MTINTDEIKRHEADSLANSLLKAAEKLFNNPQIQAEFEQWQRERQQKGA